MIQSYSKSKLSNILILFTILLISFLFCLILTKSFEINEQITIIFVFAIFLILLLTDGYFYGIIAAFIAMLLVNYAFTYPYFAVNFTIPENFISAIIMISVSLMTSTLTTQLKHQEALKSTFEVLQPHTPSIKQIKYIILINFIVVPSPLPIL